MDFLAILSEHWSVIEGAPLAFIIFFLLGGAAGGWMASLYFGGTIGGLREQLAHKDEVLRETRTKLKDARATEVAGPKAHPDSILQYGKEVGVLVGGEIKLNDGRVYAKSLRGGEDFNPEAVFIYRGLKLRLENSGSNCTVNIAGAVNTQLTQVTCVVLNEY